MDYQNLEDEITLLHERICSALGDTKRILILYLLAESARYVNEIVEILKIPQSTVSRHLRILRERNLVNANRQGTSVEYSISDARIIGALDILRSILATQIQSEAAITESALSINRIINRS